jgi:hypothetical protein
MTMRRVNKSKRFWNFGIAAVLLTFLASDASAGTFLSAFTGSSEMSENGTVKGVISFAVYQPSSPTADWLSELNTTLGTSLTASYFDVVGNDDVADPDTTAHHVFLYQVVNTGTTNIPDVLIPRGAGGSYTAAGVFVDKVFKDVVGVNSGLRVEGSLGDSNPGLGTNPSGDDTVDGFPSISGATVDSIVDPSSTTNTREPALPPATSGVSGVRDLTAGFVTFQFGSSLLAGRWSAVLFLVSDMQGPPTYAEGRLQNGSDISNGDIPRANPEPSSLALMATGLLGLFGFYRKVKLPVG